MVAAPTEQVAPVEPLTVPKSAPGPPSLDQYEHGYDAATGRVWRKAILGPKARGPVEWSFLPSRDVKKQSTDPVECCFSDGMAVIVPHLLQEPRLS